MFIRHPNSCRSDHLQVFDYQGHFSFSTAPPSFTVRKTQGLKLVSKQPLDVAIKQFLEMFWRDFWAKSSRKVKGIWIASNNCFYNHIALLKILGVGSKFYDCVALEILSKVVRIQ